MVGILIRLRIDESPEFEELKATGGRAANPLWEVLRHDWRNVLRACCLRIAETAGYAVSVTFMLSYLRREDGSDVSNSVTLAGGDNPRPGSGSAPPSCRAARRNRSAGARCTCWGAR